VSKTGQSTHRVGSDIKRCILCTRNDAQNIWLLEGARNERGQNLCRDRSWRRLGQCIKREENERQSTHDNDGMFFRHFLDSGKKQNCDIARREKIAETKKI
jgi:hypothetical protein